METQVRVGSEQWKIDEVEKGSEEKNESGSTGDLTIPQLSLAELPLAECQLQGLPLQVAQNLGDGQVERGGHCTVDLVLL